MKREAVHRIVPERWGWSSVLVFWSLSWAAVERYGSCRARSAAACSQAVDLRRESPSSPCRSSELWATGYRSWTAATAASDRADPSHVPTCHPADASSTQQRMKNNTFAALLYQLHYKVQCHLGLSKLKLNCICWLHYLHNLICLCIIHTCVKYFNCAMWKEV